jgi:hypothetical protein
MKHAQAAWDAEWPYSMNMKHGNATWTVSMDTLAWKCSIDMLHGHATCTACSMNMQYEDMDINQGHPASTCSMHMQH